MSTANLILTYDQALDAIYNDGVEDWDQLTKNLPRNHLPGVLVEVAWSLNRDDLARALTDAWVMCEFPEEALEREQWVDWFREVGYIENGEPAEPPAHVTLYRGGVDPNRMAWTSNRFVAEWFRDRWPNGKLWTTTVHPDRLLAHFNKVRLDESGQSEDEYVIDPGEIEANEI
ncbi:hypothetical protein [Mycobacterium sp. 852002-40037_SCH5390672]|uniref:hypothetical protein n=1 Tax=Mycobacterium sp. 852002-40037_SCH5390672 TaxID=1834089 RepID=UPI000805F228|nr:hypothetical protein [Mycobacterium sp. 852002-40037_SCH5390672]OBB95935.1 hypothetical protein A5782_05690 [Mycobacterium sp. 852002-40037_SCH5390672]